jgi:hypothetical protein
MFRVHCDRIVVSVIDAASVEGVFKSLRYGVRRFPAVIVGRDKRFSGRDALSLATDELGRVVKVQEPAAAASA